MVFSVEISEMVFFVRLYQQNKSSDSKAKFRQSSNLCKRVLEVAKLAYATKAKESIPSQKVNLLYLLNSTAGAVVLCI